MNHTVSVVVWGGDGPVSSEVIQQVDTIGHVAIAVHETVPQPSTCHLHHARCPDSVRFIYESRPHQIFDADVPPRGRCDLRSDLSASDAELANQVLSNFGLKQRHLPFYGEGNCHNWLAAAVDALEKAGLAQQGDGAIWMEMIGKEPLAIETAWSEIGRNFIPCDEFGKPRPEIIDARWADRTQQRPSVGRLEQNNLFSDRIEALKQLLDQKKED